jgi:hypothetical protein
MSKLLSCGRELDFCFVVPKETCMTTWEKFQDCTFRLSIKHFLIVSHTELYSEVLKGKDRPPCWEYAGLGLKTYSFLYSKLLTCH